MKRVFVAATAALFVSACATPYEATGAKRLIMGTGPTAQHIDATTVRVVARGNASTSRERVQNYAMRKAAEATLEAGYDVFAVVGTADRSRKSTHLAPGFTAAAMTSNGPAAEFQTVSAPGEELTIKLFKGPKAANAPAGVYDAREVLAYLVPATTN